MLNVFEKEKINITSVTNKSQFDNLTELVKAKTDFVLKNYDIDKNITLEHLNNKTIGIIYCGGLCPDFSIYLFHLTKYILKNTTGTKILLFLNGFVGLIEKTYIQISLQDIDEKFSEIASSISTCRNCFPGQHLKSIINTIYELNLDYICIHGGDGTLRSLPSITNQLSNINLLGIYVPCTIDGLIFSDSIGVECAARSSVEIINSLNENAWSVYDFPCYKKSRISLIEIPGRDHNFLLNEICIRLSNDIHTSSENIEFLVIPANKQWKLQDLLNLIKIDEIKISILVSEGINKPIDYDTFNFDFPFSIAKLKNIIEKITSIKTNFFYIDKLGQTGLNNCVDSLQTHITNKSWAKYVVQTLSQINLQNNFLAVAKEKDNFKNMPFGELEKNNNNNSENYHQLKADFVENMISNYIESNIIII